MQRTETLNKVRDLIAEKLCLRVDLIFETSKIREDLGADSIDEVLLFLAFEDQFGPVPEDSAFSIRTVGDIVSVIEEAGKRGS